MQTNTNELNKRLKKLEKFRKKHIYDKPQKVVLLDDDGTVFWETTIKRTKWDR